LTRPSTEEETRRTTNPRREEVIPMGGWCERAVAAVAAGVAFAALAPAVSFGAVSMTIPQSADLTAKVLVTVPVTVACGPYDLPTSSSLSYVLEQASGRDIAQSSAFLGGFGQPLFTCDGAPHVYPISMMADPAGAPFHGGNAVIAATAYVQIGDCCGAAESASVGPQNLKLH